MARCQSCRYIIERLEGTGTETWVREGTIDVTGMSGQVECDSSPTGEHVPAKMTTIERILINEDSPHPVPECYWCAWPVVAEFYIGGEPVCRTHVDDALNHATPAWLRELADQRPALVPADVDDQSSTT